MVVYKRASEESELNRILALQQRNLYANVPKEERKWEAILTEPEDYKYRSARNYAEDETLKIDNEVMHLDMI